MRTAPVAKPKLGALLPVIDTIPETDRTGPMKQRHTAKRIFERLRDEHGFGGSYTVVKDYVRLCRARGRCLIPGFDGVLFTAGWKEALWARYSTGAPRRLRQSVERYSIVKQA